MQECKISNFMELGDIIYILVLFSFFIFGIIKDIKKKEASKQQNLPPNIPTTKPMGKKSKMETSSSQKRRGKKVLVPPMPDVATTSQYEYKDISSSMRPSYASEGISAIQERQLTHQISQNINNNPFVSKDRTHPILKELTGENRSEELRKAVIYNEIFDRKY